jgi:hypothetical protein
VGTEREQQRLAVLHEYHVLDTPSTAELDAVVRLAATVAEAPAATLNLLDATRQYQLTTVGFAPQTCAREDSMCAVRLDRGEIVHLPDAREEPDYRDNPWVTGELGRIVFYASAPLISPGGYVMGTLCVSDGRPRRLVQDQIDRLQDLARIVVAFFERRRHARLSAQLKETIQAREQWTRTVLDSIDEAVIAIDLDGRVTLFNRAAAETHRPDVDLTAPTTGAAARYQLYEPLAPDGLGSSDRLHGSDGLSNSDELSNSGVLGGSGGLGGSDELSGSGGLSGSDGLHGSVGRLVPDDEVPLVAALRTGAPVKGKEMVIREAGREPRAVVANAAPLRAADGSVNGAVVALHDITADNARRRIIREAHERLATANAELRRSNSDLRNFAGAVSHDLVAPLAAVGGYLELLADLDDHEGGPRVPVWAAAASQQVDRMRALIDDLLDGAQVDSAHLQAARSDAAGSEGARSEGARSEGARADGARAEGAPAGRAATVTRPASDLASSRNGQVSGTAADGP